MSQQSSNLPKKMLLCLWNIYSYNNTISFELFHVGKKIKYASAVPWSSWGPGTFQLHSQNTAPSSFLPFQQPSCTNSGRSSVPETKKMGYPRLTPFPLAICSTRWKLEPNNRKVVRDEKIHVLISECSPNCFGC